LSLADNRLGPSGAGVLCSALFAQQHAAPGAAGAAGAGRGSGLKVLELSLNLLGDEGAQVRQQFFGHFESKWTASSKTQTNNCAQKSFPVLKDAPSHLLHAHISSSHGYIPCPQMGMGAQLGPGMGWHLWFDVPHARMYMRLHTQGLHLCHLCYVLAAILLAKEACCLEAQHRSEQVTHLSGVCATNT